MEIGWVNVQLLILVVAGVQKERGGNSLLRSVAGKKRLLINKKEV
jgi:hypothetical protein